MVPDSIHVYDEGDLRKYRTEIPNIIDDMHLSPHAYRLYGHLKRVAGAGGGSCWQNTETLSKACDMATGMISKAKAELVKSGLIVIDKKRVGKNDVDDIKIVDIWAKNFAAFAGARSQEQATRSQYETVQAGTNSQYETKKEPVKKEPIKNNNLRANDARAEPPQAMLPDSLTFDELGEIFADEFERQTDSLEGERQKQVVYAQESLLNDSPLGKDVAVIRNHSYSAPVAPRATAKGKQPNPNTKPILDAYFSLLTYKPTNAAKEAKAAKALADDGYTPEQVSAAYRRMKSETFWQLKHLSLAKVHENIGALLPALSPPGNGPRASSRDGYVFLNV